MHTALGACLLYEPGAVCISNMVLEQIWIFFQIINAPGPSEHMVQEYMVLDHKSNPKSQKKSFWTPYLLWNIELPCR